MNKRFSLLVLFVSLSIFCIPGFGISAGKGFYPDGNLKWEALYQDGEKSETKWYSEEGKLVSREIYANGQLELTEGFRADGSLEWQARNVQDNRQEVTRFDVSGQKTTFYQLLDGQPDGEYTVFYADGNPRQKVTYQMGVLEGPATTYFPSGQIEHEFSYKNGKVHGSYKTYNEAGTLLTEFEFAAGEIQ